MIKDPNKEGLKKLFFYSDNINTEKIINSNGTKATKGMNATIVKEGF